MPGPISDWPSAGCDLRRSLYTDSYHGYLHPREHPPPDPAPSSVELLIQKRKKKNDDKLKAEVQATVREYLSTLIQERKQGGAMALTTRDLLYAAQNAAQTSLVRNKKGSEHVKFDDHLVKSGLNLLEPSRSNNPGITNNKNKKKKNIYDYHWLVWKTGLTPTPAPGTPAPPTPMPPKGYTGGYTPAQAGNYVPPAGYTPVPPGGYTPASPGGYVPPTGFTPVPPGGYTPLVDDDVPLPAHLFDTGRPKSATFRSPTPMLKRCGTPAVPNMTASLPDNTFMKERTEYKPALHAWISQANDYERDVAYNLFQALDKGSGYIPPGGRKARPHTATGGAGFRAAAPGRHPRPVTAGIRTTVPQYGPHYSNNPTQIKYSGDKVSSKKLTQQTCDNINVGAFFQNSKLPYKSQYSIHPEFASEPRNIPWKR